MYVNEIGASILTQVKSAPYGSFRMNGLHMIAPKRMPIPHCSDAGSGTATPLAGTLGDALTRADVAPR